MANIDHMETAVISEAERARFHHRYRVLGNIPGFLYILMLFIVGQMMFSEPRVILFDIGGYELAWVEVLLTAAAIMAMAEQIKVATPGTNNTTEVLLMGAVAVVQVVLFALAAAKVESLAMFDNTEFLLLTMINVAQTAVAYQINSATLMRTISAS
jgi:hypothetical protein